jgi:hypothetical protein
MTDITDRLRAVILALLDEVDTLRDEAERLRLRIDNDAIRLRAAADAGEF